MSVDQRIVTATEQLEADVKLTHDIVNGGENTEVQTEGGPVPSNAKVAKDSHDEIIGLLQPTVNDINQHADYVDGKVSEVKADANRADAAADRADQIAELETVRDALRLAAVPAPDFHLPLISDLRVQEGFGDPDQIDVSAAQDGSLMVDLPTRSANFTRSSAKWYVSKSGVLAKAEVDEPAFEKEGVLIEGVSTNYIRRSQDVTFGSDGWTAHSTADVVNTNSSDPFGGNSAFRFKRLSDDSTSVIWVGTNVPTDGNHTVSLWISSETEVTVIMQADSTNIGSLKIPDGGYRRVELTVEIPADALVIYINPKDINRDVYIFGVQLENLFASSYIPTEGSPVTRLGENLLITKEKSRKASRGFTVSCIINVLGVADEITQLVLFAKSSESSKWGMHVKRNNLTGKAQLVGHFSYGSWEADTSKMDFDVGIPIRITVTVTENIRRYFLNAVLVKEFIEFKQEFPEYHPIYIGSNDLNNQQLNGNIKDLKIWDKPLTDEQVSALGAA